VRRTNWARVAVLGIAFAGSVLAGQQGRGPGGGGGGRAATAIPAVPRNAARPSGPNLGGRPYPIRTDVPTPTGLVAPAASYTGITPGAFKPLNNNRGGRYGIGGIGYPGFVGAPFLPYLGADPTPSFPSFSEQAEEITARQEALRQDALTQQMEQMNAELRQMRESQAADTQPGGVPMQMQPSSPPPAPAAATPEPLPPPTPITIVLQNGRRFPVSNYAVMNGVLWDFSKQPARKIPVSTINLAASQAASEESGAEFPSVLASGSH
jgi:hypothetical protein